jgi:Integrase zinc binding domain
LVSKNQERSKESWTADNGRRKAELALLKLVQEENFKEGDRVLLQLQANKDDYGVWRVRTKIIMREDSDNFRFPILLPTDHPVTRMMIEHEHLRMNHCGVQVLMTALRERFWVIKSRKTVRHVVTSCGRCRRFVIKNVSAVEAPLPLE